MGSRESGKVGRVEKWVPGVVGVGTRQGVGEDEAGRHCVIRVGISV